MKFAFLTDIHGNYAAFKECIHYIEQNNYDRIFLLGDYITDGPYPQKTMEILYKLKKDSRVTILRGNREEYMLDFDKSTEKNWSYNTQTGSLLYTYNNLTKEDLDFFSSLPSSLEVEIDGIKPFTICHASYLNSRELLFKGFDNTNTMLENLKTDYVFAGHTHNPFIYEYKGKIFVKCGSVGQPTNYQTKAQFTEAIWNGESFDIEFIYIDYNVNAFIGDFFASGFVAKSGFWGKSVIKNLETGEGYPNFMLTLANSIALNEGVVTEERHFINAAEKLNISTT